MPLGFALSEFEQEQIMELYSKDVKLSHIAKKLNRSRKVIYNFLKNPDTYGKNRIGGPNQKLNSIERRLIINIGTNTRTTTSCATLAKLVGNKVTRQTVWNILRRNEHRINTEPNLTERLKMKRKLSTNWIQQSQHRDETASSASSTMSDTDDLRIETVTSHKISNNFRPPHSSSEEIKVEPDLNITNTTVNISNDDLILPDTLNMQKRLADIDADEDPLSCSNKRVRLTQNRAKQQQWDVVLNNDASCASKNAENRFDASHLTNVADSDSGDDDNNDADDYNDDADNACNTLNTTEEVMQQAHSSSKAAQKHYESDECRFFKLLTKYKLQNYADKLKEIRIDLDCLKHIREDDIKDIFEKDVGARIRFRAVVEDWRASHMDFNSVFNQQLGNNSKAGDVVTKKDIAELKSLIKNAQNTFLQEQQKTRDLLQRAPQEQTNQYNPESTVRNHAHKEVLPKRPFDTIIDFKNFEDVITDSEEAYTSLISELMNLASKDSVGYIKSCWRRIMTDNVAKHFCWTGTPEKPAIRELHVTSALREAYLRKYQYGSMDEFQRTIISFFQYAKTRLQKKENYEKVKAAAI